MLFNILLPASIILTCLAFMFAVDLFSKRLIAPKTEEDQLVDDLINDKIDFNEFDLRLKDMVQKEARKRLNKLRKEKLKKLNNENW